MKIIKLIPRGFCSGVVLAIKALNDAIKNYPNKHIYCLGWIVHNKNVIEEFLEKNVIFLDDKVKSRYELIQELNDDNAVVVFSAHGTSENVLELAQSKGFITIDATCKYVSKVHEIIKEKMSDHKIIYIGKKNHPESISTLSITPNIIFIDVDEARKTKNYETISINPKEKYYLLNQTTISLFDYYEIIKFFKATYSNIVYDNEICDATTKRQEAVLKMDEDVELLIVVGDKRSNNSNQLVYLAEKRNVKSYLVNGKDDLNKTWFSGINVVAITAGTSSPANKITEVIEQINEWNNSHGL